MTTVLKVPILVSRSSLQRLANKYPNYLQPIIKPIKKEPDTPWGPKFKLFAYSCAAIAVPYSMGMIVSASPSLRDYLEGDSDPLKDNLGRRVVQFVRWYWGEEDAIPYSEYLEKQMSHDSDAYCNTNNNIKKKNHKDEISLHGELSAMDRQKELDIQKRMYDSYNIHIYRDDSEMDMTAPGLILYQQQLKDIQSSKQSDSSSNDRIWITFQDQPEESSHTDKENGISVNQDLIVSETVSDSTSSISDSISKLTSVFSAWHYFNTSITSSTSNTTSTNQKTLDDEFESRIKHIRERILQLKTELSNPATLRAYDDIADEIASMKQEEKQLRRERRMKKLKALFSI
jgi:hypothetical protein